MKIGCCGFPVGIKKYFESFSVVELQKTFYKFPKIETIKNGRKIAPKNFEFTLKANQIITHPISSPTHRKMKIKPACAGFFSPVKEVLTPVRKQKR